MRVIGLDLGTRTCGLAISDKTNFIASPLKTLRWDGENCNRGKGTVRPRARGEQERGAAAECRTAPPSGV